MSYPCTPATTTVISDVSGLLAAVSDLDRRASALEQANISRIDIRGGARPLIAAADAPTIIAERADFICPGDGDQAAIQGYLATLNACDCLELSPGHFHFNQPLAFAGVQGLDLRGQGRATTLQPMASFPDNRALVEVGQGDGTNAAYCADVTLRDLAFDGQGHLGTGVTGLRFGAYRGRVSGITATNFSGWGLDFSSPNRSNRTDLLLSAYDVAYCHQGGLNLGGAASDGHVMHGVVMHSGKSGTTQVIDHSHGLFVTCSSVQLTDFQSYGHTGAALYFSGTSSNSKIVNGKIETSNDGGVVAPSGLWMVQFSGCGFRAGAGRALLDLSHDVASNQSFVSVTGCTFDRAGAAVANALSVDLSANSLVTVTGGLVSGFAAPKVAVRGGQVQIRNLGNVADVG